VTRSGATTHGRDGVYLIRAAGSRPVEVIGGVRGPLGLAWVGAALYVSRLGGVDRFTGLHGTRFAHRTTILDGPVRSAENNNLVVAPNGRLVLGVSATCDHCSSSPRYAGAIVSFRTDGSGLHIVANHVRAAYGLVYSGTTLYASMNQRDDLGARTPGDVVAVVADGQDWQFPGCYGQGGAACAGVPPVLGSLDAHAAAGGVAVARGSVLVAEWMLGKVLRVPLGGGASSVWLAGLKHPLPIVRAGDGALLVGDWGTGTVYRITGT
jgi:glucose/arabinose dehydrogenase